MTPHELNREMVHAVEVGDLTAVQRLLVRGASANAARQNEPVLIIAVDRGYNRIAEVLVRAGARVNEFDDLYFTALHVAIMKKRFGLAQMLINAGADVNAQRNAGYSSTPLHMAVFSDARDGEVERVTFLLRNGVDVKREAWLSNGQMRQTGTAIAYAKELTGGAPLWTLMQEWPLRRDEEWRQAALKKNVARDGKKFKL